MRFLPLLLILLAAGCDRAKDKMILRLDTPLEQDGRIRRDSVFRSSSYWEIARTVNNNAPKPNQRVVREGQLTFSGHRFREAYRFTYDRQSDRDWHLVLFEKGTSNRRYSIHRNSLGLTLQDVQNEIFAQGTEDEIWDRLSKHPWLGKLKDTLEGLLAPSFDPSLDWHEETDGLKFYIITRIEEDLAEPEHMAKKHEIYFHKKARTLRRRLETQLEVGIVKDMNYSSFKNVANTYLPHRVVLTFPKEARRVDVSIEKIEVSEQPRAPRILKDL